MTRTVRQVVEDVDKILRTPSNISVVTCRVNIKNLKCNVCGKEITYFDVIFRYYNTNFIAHLQCAFSKGRKVGLKYLIYIRDKLKKYLEVVKDLKTYLQDVAKNSKGNVLTILPRRIVKYFRKNDNSYIIILNMVLRTLKSVVKDIEMEVIPRPGRNTSRRTWYRFTKDQLNQLLNTLTMFEEKICKNLQFIENAIKEKYGVIE